MWMWLREAALQVLTHADHAGVITRRAVYLRPLSAPLKFIETTWSSFTGVSTTMAIGNIASLKRLLTWVDPWERRGLSVLLLRLRMLRVGIATMHHMLLRQLVLVCVVVEVIAAIHTIIVTR